MNIAILGIKTYPALAGADRVVESLINNYSGENQYYIYLMKKPGVTMLACRDNLHFVYIPTIEGKHAAAFIYFLLCTVHYLIKSKCRIVHVHNSDFGLFCPLVRMKGKVKMLGTFHGNPYQRNKWGMGARLYLQSSEWAFLRFCSRLTTVAKSKLAEVPPSLLQKIEFIPNGLEHLNFETLAEPDFPHYGIAKGKFLLFACGRLDSTKGLHHLLRAYIAGGFTEKLLVIGDFTHDKEYSKLIDELSQESRNILLHKALLPKEELLALLSSCRLFIFPSEVEAMSMMLLEAIAAKVPVVCSDIVENTDIVGEAYPNLFRTKDAPHLSGVMQRVLSDPGAGEFAVRFYETIKNEFDWREIARRYEQLYSHLSTI